MQSRNRNPFRAGVVFVVPAVVALVLLLASFGGKQPDMPASPTESLPQVGTSPTTRPPAAKTAPVLEKTTTSIEPRPLETAAGAPALSELNEPAASPTRTAERSSVVVLLGDSITEMNAPLVAQRLSECGAPPVAIHALSARSVNRSYEFFDKWRNSGVDEVGKIAASGFDPTHWLVELGTNDAQFVTNPAQADALLASLLSLFDRSDKVTWVTVVNELHPSGAALINDAIRRSGVAIADWAAIVEPGDLHDGLHPSASGAEKLATMYCQVLSQR